MIEATEIQGKEAVDDSTPAVPLPKLDLACGDNKSPGFIGVDIIQTPSVDQVWDLREAPWPFEDNSIGEARCSHFFEHLTPAERITFMNELHRVLVPGAGCILVTPRGFDRMVQDFSHVWPPIVEASYYYFDKEWLEINKLTHYRDLHGITADFSIRPMQLTLSPEFTLRTEEHQYFALRNYTNAAVDLVMLVVKKEPK